MATPTAKIPTTSTTLRVWLPVWLPGRRGYRDLQHQLKLLVKLLLRSWMS